MIETRHKALSCWSIYETTKCGKFVVWSRSSDNTMYYELKEVGVVPIGGGGIKYLNTLLNRNKVELS